MDGSQRATSRTRWHCAGASDNAPDGKKWSLPATYGTAVRMDARYGCAIAVRTNRYHSHLW